MSLVLRSEIEMPFRASVKLYKKRAREIESYLSLRPNEWGRFQSEFNSEINKVFRDIMNFERSNLAAGNEDKVYKLKRLFIKRFRQIFARGVYCDWSIRKPFGYTGDFKIIEDIYENNPATTGFDRLFDNYFQMSAISVAVRNRKEDFKRLIIDFIKRRQDCKLRIMDLASGPCRELREILFSNEGLCKKAIFDCYDNDINAIHFARDALSGFTNVNFLRENALRITARKDKDVRGKYDLIYSAGLFDYFSERTAVYVVRGLKRFLLPKGNMVIANVRDKYSNPSVHFMEWGGDWDLVYRDEEEFKRIFISAGFEESDLDIRYEQQGIMQYIIALNKNE
ncbi:MAG: class I SAM-dependent methyltransferase [Candidatus Omnitrophica bacterium]|nr:class I SAM-dependent methyltransferase [Candidatus Omnitrophota bacterium]